MHAGITALLEALASIDAQLAKLDSELKGVGRSQRDRLASDERTPRSGRSRRSPISRQSRTRTASSARATWAYLGPDRETRHHAETNIGRHYKAANVLLTTVNKRFALRSWAEAPEDARGRQRRVWRSRESSLCCSAECGRTARVCKLPLRG